jgi:Tn3 transposase DDE domain
MLTASNSLRSPSTFTISATRKIREILQLRWENHLPERAILQYLSEPELRRRIRRGLLKVEQLHALARDVFFGRRGRINARELWEQMNTCSCLNLILACIVYWQACEISRVLSECDPIANGVDLSLLEHVSPIEWDNVVLYGQYILDRKLVRRRRGAKRVVLSV